MLDIWVTIIYNKIKDKTSKRIKKEKDEKK